ncbi:hypothetical protein ACFYVL_27165 [Streptomyces sp. NPDC004111]|uniref:hypothetical protein n=1 Tax=Streptomyces sp. NPDC004111 TaxID=3364690 RepID=UPI0036AA1B7E
MSHLVGTAQQPGRQTPLTGNQARKVLVESEPPERENAKAKDLESTEEISTGNGLIESEAQQHKRNTERKRPEESPQG